MARSGNDDIDIKKLITYFILIGKVLDLGHTVSLDGEFLSGCLMVGNKSTERLLLQSFNTDPALDSRDVFQTFL